MRRSLSTIAVLIALGIAACGGDPAVREMVPGPTIEIGGAAGTGGSGVAAGSSGNGSGSSAGSSGGGSAAHGGGGSGSAGNADAGTVSSDANAETGEAVCPPGGTGFTILGSAQDMVRDNATCLTWDRSHSPLGFQESKQHCQDLTLGGYDDWRMPTVEELYSLVRRNDVSNIDTTAFPNPPGSCWTSTQPDAMHSCAVGFDSGGCYKYGNSAGVWGTYCVRGTSTTLPPLSAACKMACGI